MHQLTTVFRSNIPMDCHILKGRLETEGIPCFIYDENLIYVYPFRAVAIGGVKLKVPEDKLVLAKKSLKEISNGQLYDENGTYPVSEIVENEINRQNEILTIKAKVRNNPALLHSPEKVVSKILSTEEIQEIIKSEKKFNTIAERKFVFTWKQFLYELFDFHRDFFSYLRPKPVEYYLEKELVENYIQKKEHAPSAVCPNCHSDNTDFGYAIDYKWDILYLVISVLVATPMFLFRKKYHCFNCGYNFRDSSQDQQLKT